MSNPIEEAAYFLAEECKKEGMVVHMYKSSTSNSIYLKFDWGVAHSLRISDHKGIEKYHYKFNLIADLPRKYTVSYRNEHHSSYYPLSEKLACLHDIIQNRNNLLQEKGIEEYQGEMERIQQKIETLPKEKLYPFWKYGKRI